MVTEGFDLVKFIHLKYPANYIRQHPAHRRTHTTPTGDALTAKLTFVQTKHGFNLRYLWRMATFVSLNYTFLAYSILMFVRYNSIIVQMNSYRIINCPS